MWKNCQKQEAAIHKYHCLKLKNMAERRKEGRDRKKTNKKLRNRGGL